MKAPPPDLDLALVHQALDRWWGIAPTVLPYLPLGFGDHHWQASAAGRRYFVTARDLRLDGRAATLRQAVRLLERTFRAVRRLRDVAGLEFIVPALGSRSGALVVPVSASFALSVYDWLETRPARDADGTLAAELVGRLHRAWREHPVGAVREDFCIPHRPALEAALSELVRPWQAGPYGEPARAELLVHQAAVRAALVEYDALAAVAAGSTNDWCLTHGEPSGGNLLQDEAGGCYLVDWESARIAPPERDLVELEANPAALARYRELVERGPPRAECVRLYRLWYALAETAVYLRQFRGRHAADSNLAEAWRNFLTFLPGRHSVSA